MQAYCCYSTALHAFHYIMVLVPRNDLASVVIKPIYLISLSVLLCTKQFKIIRRNLDMYKAEGVQGH